MKSVAIAFAVSPAVAIVPMYFFGGPGLGKVLAIVSLLIAYMSAIVVGLPLYLVMRRRGWMSASHLIGAGAICALPGAAFWVFTSPTGLVQAQGAIVVLLVLFCGVIGGAVFWLIASRLSQVSHG
jgi:hypothetical protein